MISGTAIRIRASFDSIITSPNVTIYDPTGAAVITAVPMLTDSTGYYYIWQSLTSNPPGTYKVVIACTVTINAIDYTAMDRSFLKLQ
jgi:hypothetical protein